MDAAVEAQMGKIMTELGDALGCLGHRARRAQRTVGRPGRSRPADRRGGLGAGSVSSPSLVREWLRAQAAGGYLTYTPATETFTLPEDVAAAIHFGPGGALVDAVCVDDVVDGGRLRGVQRGVQHRAGLRLARDGRRSTGTARTRSPGSRCRPS